MRAEMQAEEKNPRKNGKEIQKSVNEKARSNVYISENKWKEVRRWMRSFQTEALKIEKLLYHISYAMLRNESDCEDAVQEALLRAWQKRGTLRDMAAFRSWLCRIVANTCTELLRRKQRTTLTDIPEEMPAPQSDAIDHMAVMDALAELTPQMRVCMTLHYLDGWRVPEIAQMLDIPEGTVKTRLMHARKRMETLLREVET